MGRDQPRTEAETRTVGGDNNDVSSKGFRLERKDTNANVDLEDDGQPDETESEAEREPKLVYKWWLRKPGKGVSMKERFEGTGNE